MRNGYTHRLAGWLLSAALCGGAAGAGHAAEPAEAARPAAPAQVPIRVSPLGTLTVHPDQSWKFEDGPKGARSVTHFKGARWLGDGIDAQALWGNGTYLAGPGGIVEVNVRLLFKSHDGALIYLDYIARFDWDEQAKGVVAGPLMTGRAETADERYAFLNKTQLIGKGSFADGKDGKPMQMRYRLYALPNSPSPDFE